MVKNVLNRRPPLTAYVVLVVVTLLVFWPCVRNGFTTWDDEDTIARNPDLNPAVTVASLEHFWTRAQGDLYVPITYSVWAGLTPVARTPEPDATGISLLPGVYHGFNVLVHAASVLLVYELLRRLTGKSWAAMLGALFFAVHPVQVESVAWASGTKDLLAGFFALGALNCYVRRVGRDPGVWPSVWQAIGCVCFGLAMLSKPSCVALPLAAVGIGRFAMGRPWKVVVAPAVLWGVMAVPVVVVGKWAQPAHVVPYVPAPWFRPIVAADALGFYLWQLVVPIWLSIDYGRTPLSVLGSGGSVLAMVTATVAVAGLYAVRRKGMVIAGAVVFLAGVSPVLGLVPFDFQQYSTVSDHYLYLAMLGPCLVMAWLLPERYSLASFLRRPGAAVAAVVLAVLAARSLARTWDWKDSATLFARTLQVNSDSTAARTNLAIALTESGQLAKAAGEYRRVLRQDFSSAKAHLGLGQILARAGRTGEALAHLRTAVALQPGNPRGHYNLGLLLASTEQWDEAAAEYERAVELDPQFAEAHTNLGTALLMRGDLGGAEAHYRRALAIRPELTVPRRGLEAVEEARGKKLDK